MTQFESKLGIGDMIYSVNSEGFKHPYIIHQVVFTNGRVEYKNHIGAHICYEWELDNIYCDSTKFYFTSKIKRDIFIKMLNT